MLANKELYPRIVASKNYIDQNYYRPLRLEDISRKACISRYHFHRLFTCTYGKTPHEYLTLKRLHHAKLLLQQEGISIKDVCFSVGFESLASFSLLFRKRNGYAPQYYRNLAYLKNKLLKEEPARFIPHCIIENMTGK
jgi:AraC-like DNA-binding protein